MKLVQNSLVLTLISFTMAFGCGQKNDKKAAPATQEKAAEQAEQTDPEAAKIQATLPNMLISKIPLDAEGKEIAGEETVVSLAEAQDITDEALVAEVHGKGTQIAIQDELDSDSSSQQWLGWFRPLRWAANVARAIVGLPPRYYYASGPHHFQYPQYSSFTYSSYRYNVYYSSWNNCSGYSQGCNNQPYQAQPYQGQPGPGGQPYGGQPVPQY